MWPSRTVTNEEAEKLLEQFPNGHYLISTGGDWGFDDVITYHAISTSQYGAQMLIMHGLKEVVCFRPESEIRWQYHSIHGNLSPKEVDSLSDHLRDFVTKYT